MKIYPLFGNGIVGKSQTVTAERRLNCYFENRPDGDKTRVAVYGTPGLNWAYSISGGLPARGLYGSQTALFCVSGNQFIQLDGGSYSTSILTSSGNVSFAGSANRPADHPAKFGTFLNDRWCSKGRRNLVNLSPTIGLTP